MDKKNTRGIFFAVLFLCAARCAAALEADALSLEPIVVSKQKVSLSKSYRFDEEQLKSFAYDSPLSAARLFPLDAQSRSPHADIQSDFSMRGSTFQGVLMLLDGARINDPQTGHHNADIPFTKEDIASVEALPGAASSLYGPDAIGGALQLRTKKPEADERILELSGGEFSTSKELLSVTERMDPVGLRLSVENQQSKGSSEDTDYKKFTSALSSMWSLPDGEFDLNFGYQEKEFGAFDFYTPGLKYPSKEWTKTYLLNSSVLLQKDWAVKPTFLWRRHYDRFMLDKTELRSKYLNHHRTDMFTPGVYFSKDTGFWGEVGLGAEYGNERIRSTNLGKYTRNHKSVFLDDSILVTQSLRAGASARVDDYDRFDTVYTGSFSLRYYLTDERSVHAGLNRSMRVPSFTELYYNDPTTVGDENLSAEKAVTYQAGYEDKRKEWLWGCVLFFRNEHEVIDWVKQSPSQAKWKVENITEADVSGIETYYQVDIQKALSVNAYYDYTNKRINDRGLLYKYGPNYARHKAAFFINGNFPYITPSIGATYKKSPRRGGWVLWDSRLTGKVNKHTQVYCLVSNIFDKEYQDIEGIPSPGRWFEAGIRLEW